MNRKFLMGFLRNDDAGDAGGGGGDTGAGGDAGGGADDSHIAAAQALFDGKGASGAGDAGKGDAGDAAKGDAGKGAGDGKAKPGEGAAPKSGLLGKFTKKPADGAAKGDDGAQGELPEDKINLGDKAAPETAKHFSTLKGITKQLRGDLTARETRIKELEAKVAGGTALPADYDKLKAEHKAFSDRIAVLDVQSHPDFIRQFTEPKQKLIQQTNAVLSDNKVEGVDVSSLLHKPRAEFMKAANEIAEKLPDYDRFEFMSAARQLYQLSQSEREAIGQSSELAKNLQAKTLQTQREAFSKTWEKLGGMGEFLLKLEAEPTATPEEKSSIDAYNKAVDDVRANAEKLAFDPSGEEGVAHAAVKAASFDFFMQHAIPRMEAEYTSLVELVTQLQGELKELRGSKGEAGGGGGDGDAGGNDSGETEDHLSAAKKVFRR
jgi:hypothetical protein